MRSHGCYGVAVKTKTIFLAQEEMVVLMFGNWPICWLGGGEEVYGIANKPIFQSPSVDWMVFLKP